MKTSYEISNKERREMITTRYSLNRPIRILSIIKDALDPKKETGLVWAEDEEYGFRNQLLISDLQPEGEVQERLNELRKNES